MAAHEQSDEQLLLGIDLGTSRTAVVSSRGYRHMVRSVVGYPKDIIGIKMLGKTQAFGDEALQKKSALVLYHPLEDGVIREGSERDYNAAFELLRHVIELAAEGPVGRVSGIIGVPARASVLNKELLHRIADELLDTALVVSEPFMVAYHLNKLGNCIVIDIGAGTVDLCAMKGTVPAPEDQVTLLKGGDYIDERLAAAIAQHYPQVQLTRNLVRTIKEEHAFVGEPEGPVMVTLRSQGKPAQYDLTTELRQVCESIVPEIVEQLATLIKGFDPEEQQNALDNIVLAGGGSRIRGLDAMIADALREYGRVRVTAIDDSDYAGALGALRLATELPPEHWGKVGFAGR
jgi:rod shape-determining protein MreB and related proteins